MTKKTLRECYIMMCTGHRAVGKSYKTFFRQLIRTYDKGKKNILIFDVNDEYGVMKANDKEAMASINGLSEIRVPALSLSHVRHFSRLPDGQKQIRRIRPVHDKDVYEGEGEKRKLIYKKGSRWNHEFKRKAIIQVLDEYRNGVLLIEDITNLFGDSIPLELMGAIISVRHVAVDVIIHVQSVGVILPRFWQNINYTRYHRQMDGIEKSKSKLADKYELYVIAEALVEKKFNEGNERVSVFINNILQKIKGDYAASELKEVITSYLLQNKKIYKYLEDEVDMSGKKKRNTAQAIEIKKEQLFAKYYGNNCEKF